MFENPRRGRQARNFTTNVPKILDLKSFSEQIFFRKLSLGALDMAGNRSRFSRFSINLTYLRIPTNPNYHMSMKKRQAILNHFIDLMFSLWLTLSSENETIVS